MRTVAKHRLLFIFGTLFGAAITLMLLTLVREQRCGFTPEYARGWGSATSSRAPEYARGWGSATSSRAPDYSCPLEEGHEGLHKVYILIAYMGEA